MFLVACSGFPIAVSRYLQEFTAVEVADTEIGIPGTGTLRRWQREAPDEFVFSVLAPAEIGANGFATGGETDQALKKILAFAKKLGAKAVVFRVPEEVTVSRPIITRAKKILMSVRGGPKAILDAPHWPIDQVEKLCASAGAVAARDPLALPQAPRGAFAYLTLPGPAGHRSRYDEDAIASIAAVCQRSEAETTWCVFRNIDMDANAKSLIERVGEGRPT